MPDENPYQSPETEGSPVTTEGRPLGERVILAILGLIAIPAGLVLLVAFLFVVFAVIAILCSAIGLL